ncbi:hypothetical protein G7Y89_g4814 [Cudoniella acicularis]|uniref:Rhodopsin domain-containing protein n=1 Tax=Cudoniella acicularis TaxID=354080 RepID=A0A8H4RQR4_9HELO|nr:hypothetical protein G7Y89_g4814 [Cudoniella acicularis]
MQEEQEGFVRGQSVMSYWVFAHSNRHLRLALPRVVAMAAIQGGQQANGEDADTIFEGQLLEAFAYIQIIALTLIKIGAVAFYKRIFCNKSKQSRFKIVINITFAIVIFWSISMILMNSLQCGTKITALWTGTKDWVKYCSGLAASLARMVFYIEIELNILSPTVDYRLVDTLQVYWSIFEAGLSLLAVNLPSLWVYCTKVLPTSVVASIRSAFSMVSLGSNNSRNRNTQSKTADGTSLQSALSQAGFVRIENESHAMHDIEAQHEAIPPPGVIMVSSTVKQEERNLSHGRAL